jgi:hypothetical protein
MQATLKQRSSALHINRELGIELPKELTVDAYAEWLATYTPVYVKSKSESELRDINNQFSSYRSTPRTAHLVRNY